MASILKVDELQGIVSAGDITVTSEVVVQRNHFSRGWRRRGVTYLAQVLWYLIR